MRKVIQCITNYVLRNHNHSTLPNNRWTTHVVHSRKTVIYRAKRASLDRSGFFMLAACTAEGAELLEGDDDRFGSLSAAFALSSKNLSNSSFVTPSSASSPFISVPSHSSTSSMSDCETGIYTAIGEPNQTTKV